MKANTVGDFFQENILREDLLLNSAEPLVTVTPSLVHVDGIGFIIVVEDAERTFSAIDTDHVVAATKTWTFANGTFGDGDIGATFVVTGSGSNDGTYTVDTVTSATVIASVEAPTGNETFDEDVSVTLTDEPLQASVQVEVSNNYVQETLRANQITNGGDWADVTASFSPAFNDITAAGNQYGQMYPLVAMRARITIIPDEGADIIGASKVSIYYSAKGNR